MPTLSPTTSEGATYEPGHHRGGPDGDTRAVKHHLANMLVDTELAAAAAWDAARGADLPADSEGAAEQLHLAATAAAAQAFPGAVRVAKKAAPGADAQVAALLATAGPGMRRAPRRGCGKARPRAYRPDFSSTWMPHADPSPMTWARPTLAPSIWRSPASPRRW